MNRKSVYNSEEFEAISINPERVYLDKVHYKKNNGWKSESVRILEESNLHGERGTRSSTKECP